MSDGFSLIDVLPSPNAHAQPVTEPDEWSVKLTVNGVAPLVGLAVKLATGGGVPTVSVTPTGRETPVAVLLKVIVSVYVPAVSELAAAVMDAVMFVPQPAPRFPAGEETFNQLVWFVAYQNNGIVSKFVSTQI
jgi:hypothetical protein